MYCIVLPLTIVLYQFNTNNDCSIYMFKYFSLGAPGRSMGRITKRGQFHLVRGKTDQYLFTAPDLAEFTLKPYIQSGTSDVLGRATYTNKNDK